MKKKNMKTKKEQYSSIIDPDYWYNHHLKQSKIKGELNSTIKNKITFLKILKLLKKLITSLGKKTNNRIHYCNNKFE